MLKFWQYKLIEGLAIFGVIIAVAVVSIYLLNSMSLEAMFVALATLAAYAGCWLGVKLTHTTLFKILQANTRDMPEDYEVRV